jgi:antitoxin CptB
MKADVPPDELSRALRWRCRRGMRELDLLLTRWLDTRYEHSSSEDRALFQQLLELPDPELAAYLLVGERPNESGLASLVARMRAGSDGSRG